MRKINKGIKPEILKENEDQWTKELMSYIEKGESVPKSIQNKYNNSEIKDALKKETNGKCMYCESKIEAVSYAHIEHYRPKKLYPQKTFDWDNLGLGCQICNMNKSDSFNEKIPFINPYNDDPEDYFIFLGSMVVQKLGQFRGEFTIKTLQLNRGELMEQRSDAIKNISNLLERYNHEKDITIKEILKQNIIIEYGEDKAYSRCIKAAVQYITGERW